MVAGAQMPAQCQGIGRAARMIIKNESSIRLIPPPFDLNNLIAVVTGGGRGLGRAIVEGLAGSGARVVITGRSVKTLQNAVDEIVAAGGEAVFKTADVSSENDIEALNAFTQETYGTPDILVNNAGINPYYQSAEKVSTKQWQEIIDVNLSGVFICSRIFGDAMAKQQRGSIINISSIAGHVGLPKTAAYCAAKGGVELMTKSLALDWAIKGVRVNCIAPGYFNTDLTSGLRDNDVLSKRLLDATPMARFGRPEEVAGAAVFLASNAASYITGQTIMIDGGWTAG